MRYTNKQEYYRNRHRDQYVIVERRTGLILSDRRTLTAPSNLYQCIRTLEQTQAILSRRAKILRLPQSVRNAIGRDKLGFKPDLAIYPSSRFYCGKPEVYNYSGNTRNYVRTTDGVKERL